MTCASVRLSLFVRENAFLGFKKKNDEVRRQWKQSCGVCDVVPFHGAIVCVCVFFLSQQLTAEEEMVCPGFIGSDFPLLFLKHAKKKSPA